MNILTLVLLQSIVSGPRTTIHFLILAVTKYNILVLLNSTQTCLQMTSFGSGSFLIELPFANEVTTLLWFVYVKNRNVVELDET